MAKEKIILDGRNMKKDGTYPIKIYLRNRREILIPTQYSAKECNFKDGSFSKSEPNFRAKNALLQKMLSVVVNEMVVLETSGELAKMNDKCLKEHLMEKLSGKKKQTQKKFIDYMDEYMHTKKNEGTLRTYTTTRNKLIAFDSEATFETIDKQWLSRFENWMTGNGMKINSTTSHFKNIRSVFNWAIENDYTNLYPFKKYKIKSEETFKRCLSLEQIRRLKNCELEPHQEKYRDIFMLMFYLIGINAGDLFMLKKDDLYNGRIEYNRMKTHKYYSIKVEPEAMEIIEKYKGEEYLLRFMDGNINYKDILKQVNTQLKKIEGFEDISTYWSRFTWATFASELDIPIETISMALGHKAGYKITNVYIKFNQKKIDDANRKVINYVNNTKM